VKIAENDLKVKTHRNRMGYSDLQPPPVSPSENLRIGKDQKPPPLTIDPGAQPSTLRPSTTLVSQPTRFVA
jgi:hypothetical protein